MGILNFIGKRKRNVERTTESAKRQRSSRQLDSEYTDRMHVPGPCTPICRLVVHGPYTCTRTVHQPAAAFNESHRPSPFISQNPIYFLSPLPTHANHQHPPFLTLPLPLSDRTRTAHKSEHTTDPATPLLADLVSSRPQSLGCAIRCHSHQPLPISSPPDITLLHRTPPASFPQSSSTSRHQNPLSRRIQTLATTGVVHDPTHGPSTSARSVHLLPDPSKPLPEQSNTMNRSSRERRSKSSHDRRHPTPPPEPERYDSDESEHSSGEYTDSARPFERNNFPIPTP